MKTINVTDTTMRRGGKNAAFTLSFREKIELAKLLDRLGVSAIEVSALTSPKLDRLLIKSISSAVKESAVAVSVGLAEENVPFAWDALREAAHPRLQVLSPVSAVQMEYIAGKKPDEMLRTIDALIRRCREFCADVEWIADDATRADSAFLCQAVRTAVEAGATTVTLCDAAGMMLPDAFAAFLRDVKAAVPELAGVTLGISCSNELSMADACAVAAVREGVTEVKCTACGDSVVQLGKFAKILAAQGSLLDAETTVRTTSMNRLLEQIERMFKTARKDTSPFDNGVRDETAVFLTGHDDREAVLKAAEKLGYELSEEDGEKVFDAFRRIAEKKETVGMKELDAIVASAAMQVPPTYVLESYVINSGNLISATAHVRLQRQGAVKEGISLGDGPIDAAFLAIEQIAGTHYELDDFQIQAVTEGREAMGEAVVKLRRGGKLYSGRGISTDVVGASVHAYLSALNKIAYEETAG